MHWCRLIVLSFVISDMEHVLEYSIRSPAVLSLKILYRKCACQLKYTEMSIEFEKFDWTMGLEEQDFERLSHFCASETNCLGMRYEKENTARKLMRTI